MVSLIFNVFHNMTISLITYLRIPNWLVSEKRNSVLYPVFSIFVYAIFCLKNFLFSQESLSKCNFLWAPFSSATFNFKKYFLMSVFSFHSLSHICSVHWPSILFFSYGIYYIELSLLLLFVIVIVYRVYALP